MQTYRSSILPVVAITLTIILMTYSACHESKAESKPESGAIELKEQISRYEDALKDLEAIHLSHIKSYSDEMGCVSDSKALAIINAHNEILAHDKEKLEAYKLQFIQADTSNEERNKKELDELKKDYDQLQIDGQEIRTGLQNIPPLHVTK
jgi:CRISPR/Cas system-associated protein Cas10 (large subunit of type III CRISPR-Cas system)